MKKLVLIESEDDIGVGVGWILSCLGDTVVSALMFPDHGGESRANNGAGMPGSHMPVDHVWLLFSSLSTMDSIMSIAPADEKLPYPGLGLWMG